MIASIPCPIALINLETREAVQRDGAKIRITNVFLDDEEMGEGEDTSNATSFVCQTTDGMWWACPVSDYDIRPVLN